MTQQSHSGIYPREIKAYVHTKTQDTNVYSTFIYNCQELKQNKCPSTYEWIKKLPSWWTHPCARNTVHPQLYRERSSCPQDLSGPRTMHFSPWLFMCILHNILYHKLVTVNEVCPWVQWATIAKSQIWGRESWKPPICSQGEQKSG